MSNENVVALPVQPEEMVGATCSTGCSPSHRRTRRFLTGIVIFLLVAISICVVYCLWSSRA